MPVVPAGAAVSLTPSSEMASGSGRPPIQKLLDRNIRPGLGVDNERIAPGDMFAQMRATISLQHASYFESEACWKAGAPQPADHPRVIRYATVDGASVAGLGRSPGRSNRASRPTWSILRTDRPNIAPINDPIGAVVWGMDTSNVDWVFVAGKPLMRTGALGGGRAGPPARRPSRPSDEWQERQEPWRSQQAYPDDRSCVLLRLP